LSRVETVKLVDPLLVERLVAYPENLWIHHGFIILGRGGVLLGFAITRP
jgi:hypothetical protein